MKKPNKIGYREQSSYPKINWINIFEDNFQRKSLGSDWASLYGNWKIEKGALIGMPGEDVFTGVAQIRINKTINSENVRVEYECYSKNPHSDLSVIFQGKESGESCFFGFGSSANTKSQIDSPMGVFLTDTFATGSRIIPGKRYHIIALKEGNHLSLTINGRRILEGDIEEPFIINKIIFYIYSPTYF